MGFARRNCFAPFRLAKRLAFWRAHPVNCKNFAVAVGDGKELRLVAFDATSEGCALDITTK